MKSKRLLTVLKLGVIFLFGFSILVTEVNADVISENEVPIFTKYGREIGLSNMSISSIVQDKNGFMWFGTQGGLNMYDSNSMEVFAHDPFSSDLLLNNLIQTMYYDQDEHVIWIGTYQGLSKYDIDKNTFKNYTVEGNGLSNPVIVSVTKDNEDNIWIGTLEGLNRLNTTSDEIETYEIPGDVIRDLNYTSTGELLIGTYEGLYRFNQSENEVEKIDVALPSTYVMVIEEYEIGTITLGLWAGGALTLDLADYSIKDVIIENENVYSLEKTVDDYLFVGTWGNGLFIVFEDNITHIETTDEEHGVGHPIIYSLYEDSSGLVWIGTNGGGLYLLNLDKSNKVILSNNPDDPNSLDLGKVNHINKFGDDFYFSIYNKGIDIYNSIDKSMTHYFPIENDVSSLGNSNVNKIVRLDETHLIMGTNGGIDIFNLTTKEFSRSGIVPETYIVYALYKEDNKLWIGTYNNGVFLYDFDTDSLEEITLHSSSPQLSDSLVNDIFIDSIERVWIGTNNGLNVFEKDGNIYTNKDYYNEGFDLDYLGSNIIKVIYEDDDNVIWIGTNGGGLSRYNENDTFTTYTALDGLPSNVILGIVSDGNGNLWIGTQNGVAKFDPETEVFTNFSLDDGIGGLDISSNMFIDNEYIYFGGIHGITRVNENYNPSGEADNNIFIVNVKVLDQYLDSDLQVYNDLSEVLDYKHNSIGFEYNSLNFNESSNLIISYMLEGFDSNFILGKNEGYVHYSNLPPGDYKFVVKSVNEIDMEEKLAVFEFTILKPFYSTVYAYMLYAIVIGIIGYLFIGFWKSFVIKEKNIALQKMNLQLEKLSVVDPLTNAYNRRHLDKSFTDLFNISVRSSLSLSLILFDLDDFKLVNDHYGHIKGDEVLKVVVERANTVLKRKTDFISRIGGDEFVVVLHDTNKDAAFVLANKIKQQIEKPIGKEEIIVQISCGLVTLTPDASTNQNEFFELADIELYKAKSSGKGLVCMYQKEV